MNSTKFNFTYPLDKWHVKLKQEKELEVLDLIDRFMDKLEQELNINISFNVGEILIKK